MTGPGPGPGASNVPQACAACKHQRRKCAPDCVLAPYFPPHRQTEFLNVHRLFGVRNIMNTVKRVDPNHREDAVRSMIHEAYFRSVDPAGGAYRILNNLQQRYTQMKAELDLLHQQLAICRSIQIDGSSDSDDRIQHPPTTFYSDILAQNFDHLIPQQSDAIIVIGIKKEGSSSSNQNEQEPQLVPYERNGHSKIDEKNNSSSSGEREETDLNSPEDVKPNVQG